MREGYNNYFSCLCLGQCGWKEIVGFLNRRFKMWETYGTISSFSLLHDHPLPLLPKSKDVRRWVIILFILFSNTPPSHVGPFRSLNVYFQSNLFWALFESLHIFLFLHGVVEFWNHDLSDVWLWYNVELPLLPQA